MAEDATAKSKTKLAMDFPHEWRIMAHIIFRKWRVVHLKPMPPVFKTAPGASMVDRDTKSMSNKLTVYAPAEDLDSKGAIAIFMAKARKTGDAAYIAHASRVAADATGRNNHTSSSANSAPPTVNFSHAGADDGEKNPSSVPAITSSGMIPATSREASAPASAIASRRR
jgi:hypothetical protein